MADRESWDGTVRGAYEIGRSEGAQAERAKLDCNSPNWKDGWQTRDAEDGFIRQEAAQAERERIEKALRALELTTKVRIDVDGHTLTSFTNVDSVGLEAVLDALGGVHPEASP